MKRLIVTAVLILSSTPPSHQQFSQGLPSSVFRSSYNPPVIIADKPHIPFDKYDQPTQDRKHVYFFDSPFAEETINVGKVSVTGGKQRDERVIFIKTPTYKLGKVDLAALTQQREEKTRIYVLSKKPEAGQSTYIDLSDVSPPSKPEVVFLKYKIDKPDEGYSRGRGTA